MKTVLKGALVAIMLGTASLGYGFSMSSASAETNCIAKQNAANNINCGNIYGPLTINTSGGGNVYFGPTVCHISAGINQQQNVECSASASSSASANLSV